MQRWLSLVPPCRRSSEITRVLNIHTLPASTVLDHVNQFADSDGKLRQASFIRAFQAFLVSECVCVGGGGGAGRTPWPFEDVVLLQF